MSAWGRLPFVAALGIAAAVVVGGEALAFASGVPPLSWVAVAAALGLMGFYLVEYSRRPAATVIEPEEEPFDDPVIEALAADSGETNPAPSSGETDTAPAPPSAPSPITGVEETGAD